MKSVLNKPQAINTEHCSDNVIQRILFHTNKDPYNQDHLCCNVIIDF